MAEYIESICRSCFHSYVCEQFNEHRNSYNQKCHFFNDHFVPADDVVEVKHGKWRYFHKQNIAVCTNCSFERDLDANFGCAVSCPNCGAKMKG